VGSAALHPRFDAADGGGARTPARRPYADPAARRIADLAGHVLRLPWAYDAALRHQWTILHAEHACYFASGCLVWWPVFHGRIGSGAKALYLFGAFVLASPLGLLLALLPSAVYSFYEHVPRVWGLSALADQQIAGVTMASEQAVVFFAVFAFYLARFFREEQSADAFRAPTVPRQS
jgi:cytochrome c oxidase assembly factor CtaG